ncbi:MAG: hypothetical protein NWE96_06520 [Candidatus Bathyarchaeota archaeon]|nr:hypothetical protein [Candidatus Bathyarchaeota archaeon]
MSIANLYFVPYVILFIALTVIVLVCFLKFPSLRKYQKKRNIAVYFVLAIIFSLLAYETYDVSLGPAVISYKIASEKQIYAGQVNQLVVSCESLSMRETSFYLVLRSTNASLIGDSPDGIQINSNSIKIPFTLNSLQKEVNKTASFKIDANVTRCEFYSSIEQLDRKTIVTDSTIRAECVFNNRSDTYVLNTILGPSV